MRALFTLMLTASLLAGCHSKPEQSEKREDHAPLPVTPDTY